MIFGDFSFMLPDSNKLVHYLNGLEGLSAASTIKIFGTHILWNGWSGARNIFYRKKLIPKFGRYKYSLYCDFIPKVIMVWLIGWLPFYSTITDTVTRVWVANLLFSIYNLFPFGNNLENCAQNCSPNVRERILVRTYPIKLSHLMQSILAILLPVFIGMCKDKWADIAVFTYWAGTWANTLKTQLATKGLDNELIAIKPIKELGTYVERIAPCWCITTAAKNPEGIFKYFIDTMLDGGDVQTLWEYGAKGTHWDTKAEIT